MTGRELLDELEGPAASAPSRSPAFLQLEDHRLVVEVLEVFLATRQKLAREDRLVEAQVRNVSV